MPKMGDGEQGFDPGIIGRKRGTPGLDPKYNTDIQNDAWSTDWATPMNAYTPQDPMISPKLGGILQPDKLGLPGNPLGIGGIDTDAKKAARSAPSAKEMKEGR